MANQVVVTLTGQSAALEASLKRLERSLMRLEQRSKTTNTAMRTGAERTAKSVNTQNQSFTLMVAKLALVTFAVQTMANIFNKTFGAVLRNIDDFQIATIAAAVAITGMSAETDRSISDVFAQNLKAVESIFEELTIVAADFFSTGQELQLAYNTLAQRGIVIRQDEFRILGKLTDQIKLLTSGQNAQIQIQQELRAILDGNVRTTTAFGKSLQARGVDVAQLAREMRATGSIKVFEDFLTGLDAATGAIRRTLESVLATFESLVRSLGRNIFRDTYDAVVTSITDVNNILIDQRDLIINIGQAVVGSLTRGFERVVAVTAQWANVLGDIVADDFLRLLAILASILKFTSGPIRAFLLFGFVLQAVTGDIKDVDKAFNILIGTLRIVTGLLASVVKDTVSGFQQLARKLNFGVAQNSIQKLKQEIAGLDNVLARSGTTGTEREDLLERRAAAVAEMALAEQELFDAAAKSVALETSLRIEALEILERQGTLTQNNAEELKRLRAVAANIPFDSSISNALTEIEGQVNDLVAALGLDPAENRLKEFLESFRKELAKTEKAEPAAVATVFTFDTTVAKAEQAEIIRVENATLKRVDAARAAANNLELARIKKLAAERSITGLQSFEAELALKEKVLAQDLEQLQVDRKRAEEYGVVAKTLAMIDDRVAEGPNALTDDQGHIATLKAENDLRVNLLKIDSDIAVLREKLAQTGVEAATTIRKETEKVNRLLQQRERENAQLFGTTSGDRAVNIQETSDIAKANFRSDNLGNAAAIIKFDSQQDTRNFAEVAKPQIEAFTKAIDDVFGELINGIVEGAFDFKTLAGSISKDLIKSGLEDLIENTKKIVIGGISEMFKAFGVAASGQAAQALALGLGILLAVLSRSGNDGDFTATGGGAGGGGVQSSAQTRGLIGGSTALPIAEINNGLMEALIPTNAILSQIERNTRNPLTSGSLDPTVLNGIIAAQLSNLLGTQGLQGA